MLDLSATVDTVDHDILTERLQQSFGVQGLSPSCARDQSQQSERLVTLTKPGYWQLHPPPPLLRLAACATHSLASVGLRLSDEAVRVTVAHRLGCKACELHTCPCGKAVDARGLHGLCCRRRHQRHHQINDIVWRAIRRAQIPALVAALST